jgi:type II secretion system protein J
MNFPCTLRPPSSNHGPRTTDFRLPTSVFFSLASGRAFTLIELLVATAITSLLILGMTGIFDQAMKAWRLSSRRGDAEREVRAALSTIQRDFSSVVVSTNLPIYRVTGTNNNRYIGPRNPPDYNGNVAVFFLSTLGTNQQATNNPGDLCGVGYYVAWDQTTKTYNLYRYLNSSSNQFFALRTFLANPNAVLFPASAQTDEIVGANVVNFRVEFKTLPALFGNVTSQDGPVITNRPGYAQLELTAYGNEAIRSFASSNDWTSQSNIQKFGRTFLWRVDL